MTHPLSTGTGYAAYDPTPDVVDEFRLVKAISDGDETAFTDLYQKYNKQVYSFLLSIIKDTSEADDVLQEVFIAVWEGASRFRQKSSPKTWIFRIANNRAISWLRRHHRLNGAASLEEVGVLDDSPEDATIKSMNNQHLLTALKDLSPNHRAVLELAFVQELSYSEIAEVLCCPVGTVKSRMSYALKNLNRLLLKMTSFT